MSLPPLLYREVTLQRRCLQVVKALNPHHQPQIQYTQTVQTAVDLCVFHCRLQRKFAAQYSGLVQPIANNNSLLTFAFAYAAITYL